MKALRKILDKQAKHFEKGGKLEVLFPLWEATDTFLYSLGKVTRNAPHVRDGADLKRIMITVVIALLPCMFMAMYNTGYQAQLAVQRGAGMWEGWQTSVFNALNFDLVNGGFFTCIVYGALFFIPVYLVTLAAGGAAEVLFCIVRKHEVNEGFLVTSALFPLILPATIPLWQVAVGILFGVIIGKEVFGGVGMNIFNPALTARAFLYFAYPAEISGDKVWIAAQTSTDGYSGATWLAVMKESGMEGLRNGISEVRGGVTWWESFIGLEPGSMGETSALFCIIGAIIIIATGVASWRIMLGGLVGSGVTVLLFNAFARDAASPFAVPVHWHLVVGGFAFAIVFMATDPVSAPYTDKGRYIYGFLIGFLGILIREVNPAYAGSWMLSILFMNMFSSTIDHYVVRANIKRRLARNAA
ncbi:MAG: NADH:ubiquinone reductase (Na(+)-transporting) subunit B [Candidatus Hydrogenedentota bacterium]